MFKSLCAIVQRNGDSIEQQVSHHSGHGANIASISYGWQEHIKGQFKHSNLSVLIRIRCAAVFANLQFLEDYYGTFITNVFHLGLLNVDANPAQEVLNPLSS